MKKLVFILILSFLGLKSYAQNINLNQLPNSERDSILLAVSKEAMLKYAPEWYHEDLITDIKYFGYSKSGKENEKYRQLYTVTYNIIDKSKIPDNWEYIAKIFVWEDSGKATQITLGPKWILLDLDEKVETRGEPVKQVPYPKQLTFPLERK